MRGPKTKSSTHERVGAEQRKKAKKDKQDNGGKGSGRYREGLKDTVEVGGGGGGGGQNRRTSKQNSLCKRERCLDSSVGYICFSPYAARERRPPIVFTRKRKRETVEKEPPLEGVPKNGRLYSPVVRPAYPGEAGMDLLEQGDWNDHEE